MENEFFVDSAHLSPATLEKKHRLETDPTFRKDPMEYLPGMEVIDSDVRERVLAEMNAYDPARYTARDVRAALDHTTCTLEDFKALLSPAAPPSGCPFPSTSGNYFFFSCPYSPAHPDGHTP